jgi:hypothetical protein
MKYTVILAVELVAKDGDAAFDIGQGAGEFLMRAYNDDRSLLAVTAMAPLSALPFGCMPDVVERAQFEADCLANMEEEGLTRSDAQGVLEANRNLADWLCASGVPGDAAAIEILGQVAQ